jgi:hypothetical protein
MINVGILYIAIGRYNVLFKEFYISSEKYFLPGCKKKYFVFTDSIDYFTENFRSNNIVLVKTKNLTWPFSTLLRYKLFYENRIIFDNISHLIFCNAKLKFLDYIFLDNIFSNKSLFATLHPGYYNKTPLKFPYDNNPHSSAFLTKLPSSIYVCGGFNGGLKEEFLSLSYSINNSIQADLKKNYIAIWHDESHLNKFLADNINFFHIIDQSYCCPEYSLAIKNPKIIVRDKNNYFMITNRGLKFIASLFIKKYVFKLSRLFIFKKIK